MKNLFIALFAVIVTLSSGEKVEFKEEKAYCYFHSDWGRLTTVSIYRNDGTGKLAEYNASHVISCQKI